MNRNRVYWGLVATLLVSAALFARGAVARKVALNKPTVTVETGSIVRLEKPIDGDTLLVRIGEDTVTLRIVGIKGFNPDLTRDPFAVWGKEAMTAINRLAEQKPLRVLANVPAKDKSGRVLATLYVDDEDLALELVRLGVALVYTAYPFPQMQSYLRAQATAKAERKGLWGDPGAVARADALAREWREREEAP